MNNNKQQNRSQRQNGKRPKKTKKSVPGVRLAFRPKLSHCASEYLAVLANPFRGFAQPPCVPDVISLPSYKVRMQSRGVFSIGTQGVGWIAMGPHRPFSNVPLGYYTTPAFTEQQYLPDPGNVGVQTYTNDSPYENGALANSEREYRLVGGGIKIRYIGTELNRSGRVILFRKPGRQNVPIGATGPVLLSDRSAATAPSSRREEIVTYLPASPTDLFYVPMTDAYTGLDLIIFVDGGISGTSYEFETVQFFEVIGSNLPMTSKSHSDPVGMSAVTQSIPPRVPITSPTTTENNWRQSAYNALEDVMSGMAPTLIQGAGTLIGGFLGGPSGALSGFGAANNVNSMLGLDYRQHAPSALGYRIDEID